MLSHPYQLADGLWQENKANRAMFLQARVWWSVLRMKDGKDVMLIHVVHLALLEG